MRAVSDLLTTNEIIDKIYDAPTLEEAIYWREAFVRRLSKAISHSDFLEARSENNLYALAKAQTEQTISRLQMCLVKNERWEWSADRRGWQVVGSC